MAHPPPPHLNPARLKTSLKMAISKLQFIQEKKTALTKLQRRQLADLLNQGKETSAKIRVENIIRDDIYIELLEFLELYCELLLARIAIILDPARTGVEPSLKEAILAIIYAAPHSELKEISAIKDIFLYKYGNEFGKQVLENENEEFVPSKIVKRCLVESPPEELVDLYLCEIAKVYQAPYSGLKVEPEVRDDNDDNDDDSPSGGIGLKATEEPIPAQEGPAEPQNKPKPKEQDDFDNLKARFAALKGR